VERGADYLDLSVGPSADDPVQAMRWLATTVREVTDCPLCFDSTNPAAIRAGLEVGGRGSLINSCSADRERIEVLYPLARDCGAKIIGLTMNQAGIPKDADSRATLAMELVAAADEFGLPLDDLFIDPLLLPVSVAQSHVAQTLNTIGAVKMLSSPPPKTVVGLSNISQKTFDRSLINRTFLVMAMAIGLDAAIVDVCDDSLIDAVATARVLLDQEIYADSYVKLFRSRKE
jgi:5-methyltetrahydrofolate corrinoid/iron sulfur protein methyltransferase